MSAPLVVNTVEGTCWTRREAVRDGQALYAPEKCGGCPDFVMATYAELEEHGIAGEAYALPVPVGPQMPEFPPPPRTEVEKLRSDVARLQGLLAEAVQDAHRALRERDLMRERVSEPYGCQHCGIAKRVHGRRYLGGAGMHTWTAPTQEQIAERMKARRTVRAAADAERLQARVDEVERRYAFDTAELRRENERLQRVADREHKAFVDTHSALNLVVQDAQRLAAENGVTELVAERNKLREQAERDRRRVENTRKANRELRARVAELLAERHVTNEALDDAVKALHAMRDQAAEKDPRGCQSCGDLPDRWCPNCAACETGCFGGFDGNACTHANAPWARGRKRVAVEDPHDGPLAHKYLVSRDLPEMGGTQ